ncbi:MAG: VCBS repeat-containing protein, partial [Planctomycetes bacterium]|nr:VCBS repeat-containing protein [Planctomycetota bacterium]
TGDLDGDGRPDLIVGFVSEQLAVDPGSVVAYSGLDRSVLFSLTGQGPYDDFGRSVATGLLDGDGNADIVVGSKYGAVGNPDPTLVETYSGLDGSNLWMMPWPAGESASPRIDRVWTGDFDGDARDDVALSIDSGGSFLAHLYLLSGVDGSTLAILSEPSVPIRDGCVGVGRFDGDAIDDLLVADRYAMQSVLALSGADYSVLREFAWPRPAASAPVTPPSVAGDVDGDGIDDVVFGWSDGPPTHAGQAFVYSGTDGTLLFPWSGS